MRHPRRIALIALALAAVLGSAAGFERASRPVRAPHPEAVAGGARAQGAGRPAQGTGAEAPAGGKGGETATGGGSLAGAPRAGASALPLREGGGAAAFGGAQEPTTPGAGAGTRDGAAIFMDAPGASAGEVTFAVTGFDRGAPRPLTLWRVVDGEAARLAETKSDPSGRFRFPEVAAGARELAVGPGGDPPGSTQARRRITPEPPPPPVARAVRDARGVLRLRVWPPSGVAAVVVSTGGRELLRAAVPALPEPRERTLDLVAGAVVHDGTLWIAGEEANGARSAWRNIDVEAPVAGADLAFP